MSQNVHHATPSPSLTFSDRALLGMALIAVGLMISLLIFAAHMLSEGRGQATARREPPKAHAAPGGQEPRSSRAPTHH
jgi:hypothetical protein